MRPTLILLLLLATSVGVCPAQHAPQLEVTAVRFWTLSDVTRIAIETNGEFRFRSDQLNNPDRLFFDLLGTRPRLGVRGVQTKPVGDKLLKRIRIAETQPGMTRIVLDLESPVDFTASQLSNPDRLMIELRPAPTSRVISSNRPAAEIPKPAEPVSPAPDPPAPAKTVVASEPAGPAPQLPEKLVLPEKPAPPVHQPPALAAKRNPSGDRTLIRALGLKVGRVVIDPGHGGHDQGSTGPGGLMEKELVLDVALRLGKLIEERLGSEVIYTRNDDTFIPLENRTELANSSKADLFLSIHANSSPYPSVSGVETYHLNLTSARDALDLASRENAGAQKTIHELSEMIQKITQRDKSEESKDFASKVQTALYGAAVKSNPAARNRGVKKAPFVVLIGANMPSILAEIGFVSNSREETLLKKADHRQKLAEALYRGLSRYAETLSHFQVASKD
jgi:N-acetylmuramoyl-L-alanine amidase